MPHFIVLLATAVSTATGISLAAATLLSTISVLVGINFVLRTVTSALTPKQRTGTAAAQQVTIMDTVSPGIIIYGKTRVSGTVAFYGTSGDNNKFLWYVIALAAHQVEAITDVWLDGIKVSDSAIDAGTGVVSGGSPPWNGKLRIWKHLGTNGQTVDTNVSAAFPSWDSNHRLRGIAYLVFCLEKDPEVYPSGAPKNFYALVKGRRIYDPRKDSTNGGSGAHRLTNPSTWEWIDNSILCAADYMTGGCRWFDLTSISDVSRLGMKELTTRIDWTQVSSEATVCDDSMSLPDSATEKRYVCNGVLSTTATHSDNMNRILSTADGNVIYSGGKQLFFCAHYDTPSLSFGDDDLAGDYQVTTAIGDNDVYNAVSAIYTDATRDYQPVTSYMRTNSTYETEDGRRELVSIDLPMVTSETQAQRLCELKLRKSRCQLTGLIKFGLNGFRLRGWSNFNWSNSELGYTNKVMKCAEWRLDPQGPTVTTIAREDFSSVYTDMGPSDYGAPSTAAIGNQFESPDPPTNLKTTGLANSILITWDPPAIAFANTEYEIEESTSSTMSSPTTVYRGLDRQFTIGKIVTTAFYYRARARRLGRFSIYNPEMGGVLGKASSLNAGLSATVSPGTATTPGNASSSATTNSVTATGTGGTPTYTYAWAFATGGTGITINSAAASTTTFSSTGLALGETRSGIARCTVTDNAGAGTTYTVDVAVTITRASFTVSANNVFKSKSGFAGSGNVNSATSPASLPNTTPSGGTPAYTYAWVRLSTAGGPNPTISNAAVQNPTFSATISDGNDSYSTWQVTVTDSLGATAVTTINVTLSWSNLS